MAMLCNRYKFFIIAPLPCLFPYLKEFLFKRKVIKVRHLDPITLILVTIHDSLKIKKIKKLN